MPTIKTEAKVKLMKSTGDLDYVSAELGITTKEADALRTYDQFKFGEDSPIILALQEGVEKALKVVTKSSLEGEAKEIVSLAVQSLDAETLASLLISGQNTAVKKVRGIPCKVTEVAAVRKDVITVDDL